MGILDILIDIIGSALDSVQNTVETESRKAEIAYHKMEHQSDRNVANIGKSTSSIGTRVAAQQILMERQAEREEERRQKQEQESSASKPQVYKL